MRQDLTQLLQRLRAATGRDRELDGLIADMFDDSPAETPPYTGSVDACTDLAHRVLPGWAWHVGYGARGVIPYAVLSHGDARHEASAPTVPLALLAVIVAAKL
jgi:hypothetical protein